MNDYDRALNCLEGLFGRDLSHLLAIPELSTLATIVVCRRRRSKHLSGHERGKPGKSPVRLTVSLSLFILCHYGSYAFDWNWNCTYKVCGLMEQPFFLWRKHFLLGRELMVFIFIFFLSFFQFVWCIASASHARPLSPRKLVCLVLVILPWRSISHKWGHSNMFKRNI